MDQGLIRLIKQLYEEKTGWGDSDLWSNQDFLLLSKMIFQQTGTALSHVTLKRIWGRVRYESLPHTSTLDTIVQFLGYWNWREFRVAYTAVGANPGTSLRLGPYLIDLQ